MTKNTLSFRRWLAVSCLAGALLSAGCGSTTTELPGDGSSGDGDGDRDGQSGDGDGDGDGDRDGQGGDGDGQVSGDGDGQVGGDGDGQVSGDGDGDTNPDPDAQITFPMPVDQYFYASGYSGDGATPGSVVEAACPQRAGEQRGKCHKYTWTKGPAGWVTIFWQFPANNWENNSQGRAIPAGAKRVSFYAWGDRGGEAIAFGAGMPGKDGFRIQAPPVVLTREPKRYTLDLTDVNASGKFISGFSWTGTAAPANGSLVFYMDDIVWDTDEPERTSPEWPEGPGAGNVSLRVRNLCPFPLYIGGDGAGFSLSPGRVRLNTNDIHNYDVPKVWASARVNAFANEGDGEPLEKAEMTFYIDGNGVNHLGYNVTYVDWVGLPLEVTAKGGDCNRASHTTVCNVPEAQIRSGCPQNFLRSGQRCLSPRSYCLNGHQGEAYCNKLQGAIDSCPNCPRGNTTEVYACSGPYAEEPRMCAALNRGMTSAPDDPDTTKYYQSGEYNDYAKWSHSVCPGIYAFSYDDWLSHGGFRDCAGGNEVRITFCPGG